jgi:hypothetical protein
MYDYATKHLEEIKKIHNFILEFNICNKYNKLSQKIDELISQYSNINMDDNDFDNLIEEKNDIIKKTKELLSYYDEIKMHLLYYAKNIKEIQNFNEGLILEVKDNFNSTKKKFNQIPKITFKQKNDNNLLSNKKLTDFAKTVSSDLPISSTEKKEEDLTPKNDKPNEKKSIKKIKKLKKIYYLNYIMNQLKYYFQLLQIF